MLAEKEHMSEIRSLTKSLGQFTDKIAKLECELLTSNEKHDAQGLKLKKVEKGMVKTHKMLLDTVNVKLRYEQIILNLVRCEELGVPFSVSSTIADTPVQTNEVLVSKIKENTSPLKKSPKKKKSKAASGVKIIPPRCRSSSTFMRLSPVKRSTLDPSRLREVTPEPSHKRLILTDLK